MKPFSTNGIWWLPDKVQEKISGTLSFNPREGSELELIGSFKDFRDFSDLANHEIILGITSKGQKVTLYKCLESNFNVSIPGFASSTYHISVVFIGHHFSKKEDIQFDCISVNYSNLEEWVRISGFEISMEFRDNKYLTKETVIYTFPEVIEADLGDFKISFNYSFNQSGDRIRTINLEQTTFIEVKHHKARHFEDLLDTALYNIQNFLCLAMGKPTFPLILRGTNSLLKEDIGEGKDKHKKIEIYYGIRNFPENIKALRTFDMCFTFADIKDKFNFYLKNWFKKSTHLQPIYDLYFGTLNNSSMYLQHRFLSLAQALESYHRSVFDGKYVTEDDYKVLYELFTESIPKDLEIDFKKSLKDKMKYLNEFSLRKRIKHVMSEYKNLVTMIIDDAEQQFIEDIVNTRNYLTHYDKDLELKAKEGKELYNLTEKIKYILEICFLREIGMSDESIKKIVSESQKYSYLRNI